MTLPEIAPAPPPPWYRTRTALVFCAAMVVNGFGLPYFSVFLKDLGFSDVEISSILGVPQIVRIILMPVLTMVADRLPDRAWVLISSAFLSLMTALALFLTREFWPILLIYTAQAIVYAPYVPVADSLFLTGVRRWAYDYGSMRLWGSVAFIITTLVGGFAIQQWGGMIVLPGMVFGFSSMVVMGIIAPRTGRARKYSPTASGAAGRRNLRRADLQFGMIGISIVQGSHGLLYTFASIHWMQLGFNGTDIAFLWSIGVLAEILTFLFSKRLHQRFSAWSLMGIGASVAVLRWILFPYPTGYGWFLCLMVMHALTFGFCHIGIQRLIVETVSGEQEATAQGNYYFYNGMFTASVTFISGYLNVQFGVFAYQIMAVIALIGIAVAAFGWSRRPVAAGGG